MRRISYLTTKVAVHCSKTPQSSLIILPYSGAAIRKAESGSADLDLVCDAPGDISPGGSALCGNQLRNIVQRHHAAAIGSPACSCDADGKVRSALRLIVI